MCHQRIKNRSEKTFQFVIGHDLGPANLNSFFPAQTTTLFHVVLYLCVFLLKLSVSEWRVILICVALFVAFLWGTVRLSISLLLKQSYPSLFSLFSRLKLSWKLCICFPLMSSSQLGAVSFLSFVFLICDDSSTTVTTHVCLP